MIVRLEYRYMQLIENNNPDDDTPVDNVCAQISDEEDSGDEVQIKQSRTKKIMNAVRNAIRKVYIRIFFFLNQCLLFILSRILRIINLNHSVVIIFY